ncbi:hypothetical protein KJS94_09265 [Flavihumibacter rivuli]|uniref:hypothetical protein n=1 Tax=Flavihumibacter rivuli TaxID=2838156 RepID=UPI001BDE63AF|nr:hypothetical protein [Flavihumibacter rivuli]ULQ58384.1 hypothetical protein KJS94_09265 [Flavihumibacter rivuli]
MKLIHAIAGLMAIASLTACDQSLPRADRSNAASLPGSQAQPLTALAGQAAAGSAGVKLNPAHGLPGHRCDIAVGAPLSGASTGSLQMPSLPSKISSVSPGLGSQPAGGNIPAQLAAQPGAISTSVNTPTTIAPPASAASGLNPKHGEPGHRCDIAVGAPLSSAPASKPAVTSTAATVKPASNGPANGLNPKHGEPGHRCDIAVGAPLSSAPVKQKTSTVTTNVNTPTPLLTSSSSDSSSTANTNFNPATTGSIPANGLNPKHGEPGHRCDIAVGAPLNSKKQQ